MHPTIKKFIFYTFVILCTTYIIPWHTQANPNSCTSCPTIIKENPENWQESVYFNTEIIKNYEAINKQLQADGFQKKTFTTADKFTIHSLYLQRPNNAYNVIICAGFSPGKKEGMAPFFKLLPDNCNILFFDARGHGESDGSFFKSLLSYGTSEYNDIIGAIQFVNTQNDKPIILLGTCSGAFHATHAILHLTKTNQLEAMRVIGLIFDSGWGSATNVAATVPRAEVHETLLSFLKKMYTKQSKDKSKKPLSKKILRNTVSFKIASPVLSACITTLHTIVYQWPFAWYEKSTNLFDKMDAIQIPIFFVHSNDDNYAPIHEAKKLACKTHCKTCWWIDEPSKHACHSLKHKELYKIKLAEYLQSTLMLANL